MQIILNEYPPNFKEICTVLPQARRRDVIFSYGDKIYNPGGVNINEHLIIHEMVHGNRQNEMGIDKWWSLYLKDAAFRYNEELLAHRAEYLSLILPNPNRQRRRSSLKIVAKRLASSLYGGRGGWKKAAKDIIG